MPSSRFNYRRSDRRVEAALVADLAGTALYHARYVDDRTGDTVVRANLACSSKRFHSSFELARGA
jgi:hypothetical protein